MTDTDFDKKQYRYAVSLSAFSTADREQDLSATAFAAAKLSSLRDFADQHQVSISTAQRCYELLEAQD